MLNLVNQNLCIFLTPGNKLSENHLRLRKKKEITWKFLSGFVNEFINGD